MIAALRRAHRWTWSALIVLVPTLVIAAWWVRPALESSAPQSGWDGADPNAEAAGSAVAADRGRVALTFDPPLARGFVGSDGSAAVVLRSEAPLAHAYWSAQAADGPALPSDAILLGLVDAVRLAQLRRPPHAAAGTLVIYSLGHHTVLTRATWPLDGTAGG